MRWKNFLMIINDTEAYDIIAKRINDKSISTTEKNILSYVVLLMNDYSFTENQTYPRPYHPNPLKRKDAYFTLIAIILSLRTTLENEQKAVDLFLERFRSINDVANSNAQEISNIIMCAGMPKKKSQTILDITNFIINNYLGDINNINKGDIAEIRSKLLDLPGVGEKSADCMLELAFNLPSIVVDTNVFRVVVRLFFEEKNMSFEKKQDILKVKFFLETHLIKDYRVFQIVHTILLLHGKYICKSNPHCEKCRLNKKCSYYNSKNINKQLCLF